MGPRGPAFGAVKFELMLEATDTINNVKAKIQENVRIPINQQRLFFDCWSRCSWETLPCESNLTLSELGIFREQFSLVVFTPIVCTGETTWVVGSSVEG